MQVAPAAALREPIAARWPCDIVLLSRAISFGARIALYGSAHSGAPPHRPHSGPFVVYEEVVKLTKYALPTSV